MQEIKYKGKMLLHIFVPVSSQVHRCNGKVFDRNADSDLVPFLSTVRVGEVLR
jgi:ATP-dependent DNA helicase RecG